MVLEIVNIANTKVGEITLNGEIFGCKYKPEVIAEVVHWQRSKRRAGTQSALTRGEVHGTTKKPFKQKGTGGARQGDKKSPHMRGGGVAFAPKPRDYGYSMPATKKRLALAMAISARISNQQIKIVDDIAIEPKTKIAAGVLKTLHSDRALIVDVDNANLKRSVRNLPEAKYLHVDGINVFDLLKYPHLVMSVGAVNALQKRLIGEVE